MNLEELRTEIDAIDDTLVNAFAQRMDVVARVSQAKKEQGLPTLDPARERAKLADIASKLHMNISTVSRHLNTMLDWGYLQRDGLSERHESPALRPVQGD